jgi:hypothetical protein
MIPISYLSRQEAIEVIAAAKFAGVPDRGAVIEARQKGIDAGDLLANDEAIAELWRAVDQGTLEVIAHGPGDRWLKMSPEKQGKSRSSARLAGAISPSLNREIHSTISPYRNLDHDLVLSRWCFRNVRWRMQHG